MRRSTVCMYVLCMYVCMYACMYVCMYMYVCVCSHGIMEECYCNIDTVALWAWPRWWTSPHRWVWLGGCGLTGGI